MRAGNSFVRLLSIAGLALNCLVSSAQEPAPLQADIREAIIHVPSQVKDAFGKTISGDQLVTTFRPAGPGPFPLVVISHGRNSEKRSEYKRERYESAARYFVRKGFAVAAPLRLGYGELAALGDPEDSVSCGNPRYATAIGAAAQQIIDVARYMAAQPDIDAQRIVLVGVSVGGISTIAATATHMPGQVAAINFAGGHGGSPDRHPGEPCQPNALRSLYGDWAAANAKAGPATPTLWIYAENDHYFSPQYARRWAEAYREAGGAVDLQVVAPHGEDGHKLFGAGNEVWQPLADEFLKQQGFDQPGRLQPPAALGPLPDTLPDTLSDSLPAAKPAQQEGYKKFLALKLPRALALSDDGHWGDASGDDRLSKALARCQRGLVVTAAHLCHLYAVDEAVVWSPSR